MKKETSKRLHLFLILFFSIIVLGSIFMLGIFIKCLSDVNEELSERCFTFCELNNNGTAVLNQCIDGLNTIGNASINKISTPSMDCYKSCGW